MISLTLPLPPSKNALHTAAKRWTKGPDGERKAYQGMQKTAEYVAYIREVAGEVWAQTTPQQRDALQGKRLYIHVSFRMPTDKRKRDAANIIDGCLDALKGPLGIDDDLFWAGTWLRHEIADLPVCRVLIEEVPS